MTQVLSRAFGVLRNPGVILVFLALAGGGAALVTQPLLGLPGYELSAVLSLAHGLLGMAFGVACARQERRLLKGIDPRPKSALRHDGALDTVVLATLAAFTLHVLALVPPFAISVVYALVSTRCDPFAQVGFYPWLTLPSGLVAAAFGTWVGFVSRRWWSALLAWLVVVVVNAVWTGWPIVFGPQIFAWSHLAGFMPGPLYDEALKLGAHVYWFRLESLAVALAVVAASGLALDLKEGRLTRPHVRPVVLSLLGGTVLAILALEERGPVLGFRMTDEVLAERLGGKRETEHFVLHYPRSEPKEEVERTVRDLEHRFAQVSAFLGAAPPGKVTVWWYRSAAEKLALVGAAHTQYAKPWRREIHVNDDAFPHRVLKHELVHAMAAPFGAAPFGVAASWGGLKPNPGLVEGLAVAGDLPNDELTLHEWAAAMKKQKLLPDARTLFTLEGFYAAPAQRAYTAAGSFVRWLGDTHGGDKLRAAYRAGDFAGVYGRPLPELVNEWETFLDAVPLDEAAVNQAFARFRRGSLFQRACAREVASLSKEASELLASDPESAAERYHRCGELQPDEPGHVMAEATALARAGRRGDGLVLLQGLAEKSKAMPAVAAEVAMARADLEQARGETELAKARLEEILRLEPSPPMERTTRVKLAALGDHASGPAVWSYFKGGKEDVKLLVLREALARAPGHPMLSYLLGRRLTQGGVPTLALPYLRDALRGELPEKVRIEARRLELEATYLSGDCPGVHTLLGQLPSMGAAPMAQAREWGERCELEQALFSGALVPEEPLR